MRQTTQTAWERSRNIVRRPEGRDPLHRSGPKSLDVCTVIAYSKNMHIRSVRHRGLRRLVVFL